MCRFFLNVCCCCCVSVGFECVLVFMLCMCITVYGIRMKWETMCTHTLVDHLLCTVIKWMNFCGTTEDDFVSISNRYSHREEMNNKKVHTAQAHIVFRSAVLVFYPQIPYNLIFVGHFEFTTQACTTDRQLCRCIGCLYKYNRISYTAIFAWWLLILLMLFKRRCVIFVF